MWSHRGKTTTLFDRIGSCRFKIYLAAQHNNLKLLFISENRRSAGNKLTLVTESFTFIAGTVSLPALDNWYNLKSNEYHLFRTNFHILKNFHSSKTYNLCDNLCDSIYKVSFML